MHAFVIHQRLSSTIYTHSPAKSSALGGASKIQPIFELDDHC
jgi:hypothetical protein